MKISAIILAAGPGTRLTPHTQTLPKCLVKIGKNPILYYQLKNLQKSGINEIIITVGYKKDVIIDYTKYNFPDLNINFVHNPIFDKTNTLYSLALASKKITGKQNVILLNGDVFFDPKIISLILKDDPQESYSCVQWKKCGKEEIKFVLNNDGSVKLLNKKISIDSQGESIGINKFSSKFWEALSRNLDKLKDEFSHEYFEFAIEKTINNGSKLWPIDIGKLSATEIDFPKDLKKAEKELKLLSF